MEEMYVPGPAGAFGKSDKAVPEGTEFRLSAELPARYGKKPAKPEILAPAGTFEALCAAVKAGADAVYIGGDMFSARAFAGNFDKDELIKAIDYCHIFNTKIYLAVNTLLKEEELKSLCGYIEPFYKEGLDGVIVQDMGVSAVLAEAFPDLPLHASTQMSISSRYGAAFLKSLGFTRVVPARELSIEEIKSIKEHVDIEIETFIHGAMCYCYSGKCLFSSFSGGRSGNRGRCAQPCRKLYRHGGKNEYIMSLKDMCSLELVPELIEAGIDSFKIEGRMKKPEYVAGTVRAYRKAVDMYFDGAWDAGEILAETDDMRDIYNRGGFSSGYYHMQSGSSMLARKRPNHTGLKVGDVGKVAPPYIHVKLEKDVNAQDVLEIRPCGVELTSAAAAKAGSILKLKGNNFRKISRGMEVFRTRNNALLNEIKEDIIDKEIFVRAKAHVTAKIGEPLEIEAKGGGVSAKVTGNIVQKAQNKAAKADDVIEKMKKTTGTGVRFETECELDEGAFIPMSELNELRRRAVEEYKKALAARGKPHRKECGGQYAGRSDIGQPPFQGGQYISIKTEEQLYAVLESKKADVLIVPAHLAPRAGSVLKAETASNAEDAKAAPEVEAAQAAQPAEKTEICIALPDVMRENKLDIIKGMISEAKAVIIENIDELGFLKESGFSGGVIGGEFLYAYNSEALAFYRSIFPDMRFIFPAELTDVETEELEAAAGAEFIYKAYGRQKLMATAQYLDGPFKDEKGNSFTAVHDEINNISGIYMAKPVSMLDKKEAWKQRDVLLDFTTETAQETKEILGTMSAADYIRGHHYRGID